MEITLKSLKLINFKGTKDREFAFSKETNISGENATGKTTILDSFLWLLFGKDSEDKKDFNIKTLDSNGIVIPQVDHEVIGVFVIDSRFTTLQRIYREKWVKPRGQAEAEFSGHETIYYVDKVPCSQKDYQAKVDAICKEDLFKLLTNPRYFPELNWTTQRASLFSMIPRLSPEDIVGHIDTNTRKSCDFDTLLEIINTKSLEDYRKQLSSQKKLLKSELELIPSRIDEVNRSMPEIEDYEKANEDFLKAEKELAGKDSEKTDKSKGVQAETDKRATIQAKINDRKLSISAIESHFARMIDTETREKGSGALRAQSDLEELQADLRTNTNRIKGIQLDLDELNARRDAKLKEWHYINNEKMYHEVPGVCPVCSQDLPDDFKSKTHQDNLTEFNLNKANRLETNVLGGKLIAEEIAQREEALKLKEEEGKKLLYEIEAQEVAIESLKETKEEAVPLTIEQRLADHPEHKQLTNEISIFEKALRALGEIQPIDTSVIDQEIADIRKNIGDYLVIIGRGKQRQKAVERIDVLSKSQQSLSQEIATLEGLEYTADTYTRTNVKVLEDKVNDLFKYVRFKMFDLQINGQLAETCICTMDGVPYPDLNNAAKINAGLDIINTLSNYYGIFAPIFIDNRESVNDIIKTQTQIINLYVTKDKSLIIN